MKKNKMMRIASVLLVAVLLSTCAISGTFAKYVTSNSANANARVAKWGVGFTLSSNLFEKAYETHDANYTTGMTYSVKSTTEVVAPGTSGNALKLTTDGTEPEVSYKVTAKVLDSSKDIVLKKNASGNAINYKPVKFTLSDGDGHKYVTGSLDDIMAYLNTGVTLYWYNVTTDTYYWTVEGEQHGNSAPTITLSWSWAFEQGFDNYDTILGDLAAGSTKYDASITTAEYNTVLDLGVEMTATQID